MAISQLPRALLGGCIRLPTSSCSRTLARLLALATVRLSCCLPLVGAIVGATVCCSFCYSLSQLLFTSAEVSFCWLPVFQLCENSASLLLAICSWFFVRLGVFYLSQSTRPLANYFALNHRHLDEQRSWVPPSPAAGSLTSCADLGCKIAKRQ